MSETCDLKFIESVVDFSPRLNTENVYNFEEKMEPRGTEVVKNKVASKLTKKKRPSIIPTNLRYKEERKRVLRITINKLNNIDAEGSLFRTSLINNTLKRLEKEVHEDRLEKLQFNYTNNFNKHNAILTEVQSNSVINSNNLITGNDVLLPGNETNCDSTDVSTILKELSLSSTNIISTNLEETNSFSTIHLNNSSPCNLVPENYDFIDNIVTSCELPSIQYTSCEIIQDTVTFFNEETAFVDASKFSYISMNGDSDDYNAIISMEDPLCCKIDEMDLTIRKRTFTSMNEAETENIKNETMKSVDPLISGLSENENGTILICDKEDNSAKRVKCDK